ncbi:MAG: tripartite tricarboxylate transporter TctB family protein [Pseudomonadota bacterium]
MVKRDILSCFVLLFISILVLIASLRLGIGPYQSPGPGFIPFWSCLLLFLFTSLLLGVRLIKTEDVRLADLWKGRNWGNTIIVVAVLIVYCLALPKAGYLLATLGLMLVLFTLGKMKFWVVVPCALLAVLFTYGLFDYLLKMPLPRGILGF